uniref:Putative longitudinals lacking protein isoform h/m/v n=1 Tax=Xenopsylla cheopis TaxID=163159 RepID=A0A6M2DXF1_XENCH
MEDDQQFCLKWNNHQSTLISQFDTLLENETLVDCTLAAEGKYLRAHKVVLSACSPYFESLLRLQYDKHPIFILKDVKYQELRAMIDYMYRGQVNISQDQLGALLKAAETLQIKGLSDSRTNEKKQPERVPSPPLPSSTKSSGPTISKPIVKPPPPDDDIADQSSPADRETSSSPTSRKRRRSRRHSNDESAVLPDNHELSNSSTHSEFVSHLSAQSSINRPSITDRTENSTDTFQSPAIAKTTEKLNVPKVKEIRKSEQHSELILEPKSEYVDEEGNDSVEDLTLEDEDMDDMDQSQAGPSHGGEGSSQGFAGWHNMGGDRTQDEVFMAAQDAAAGHRDSQVLTTKPRAVALGAEEVDLVADLDLTKEDCSLNWMARCSHPGCGHMTTRENLPAHLKSHYERSSSIRVDNAQQKVQNWESFLERVVHTPHKEQSESSVDENKSAKLLQKNDELAEEHKKSKYIVRVAEDANSIKEVILGSISAEEYRLHKEQAESAKLKKKKKSRPNVLKVVHLTGDSKVVSRRESADLPSTSDNECDQKHRRVRKRPNWMSAGEFAQY